MAQSNRCTMKWRILVISWLAVLLLASGVAAAQELLLAVELPRVVGAAGFTSTSVGSRTLHGTLGQPLVGMSHSGNVDLGHGFWHGGEVGHTIYLPVVKRN